MAHMIETRNGIAQMVYAGDTPWHGLGTRVPADLTPIQMLDAAGLNWRVDMVPSYYVNPLSQEVEPIGRSALVRDVDGKLLDVVSEDWNPVQNEEAFEFFNDFVAAGDMEMHTAGSLRDGQIVWGLAKVKESFELFKGDQIDSYLLFSNFHKYGHSTDVRFTPIRVVCNNTLTLSLNSQVEQMAKISHRKVFNPDDVKGMLGIAHDKLAQYKEMAAYLGSKRYTNESIVDYFKRIFPVTGSAESKKKEISRNAQLALDVLNTQPGAEYAPGTWWQGFNAITYLTDHQLGRTSDNRLTSAWYGSNRTLKTKALETAVEMAEVA
jgi:phage/plasmid-like protein (TIGR03299 family)